MFAGIDIGISGDAKLAATFHVFWSKFQNGRAKIWMTRIVSHATDFASFPFQSAESR